MTSKTRLIVLSISAPVIVFAIIGGLLGLAPSMTGRNSASQRIGQIPSAVKIAPAGSWWSGKKFQPGKLMDGERAVPRVSYYTFGGVNPNFFRLYAWLFTAMSSVQQLRNFEMYYKWETKAADLGAISPILDKLRDFAPEMKPGFGDGLVSDARNIGEMNTVFCPWPIQE